MLEGAHEQAFNLCCTVQQQSLRVAVSCFLGENSIMQLRIARCNACCHLSVRPSHTSVTMSHESGHSFLRGLAMLEGAHEQV